MAPYSDEDLAEAYEAVKCLTTTNTFEALAIPISSSGDPVGAELEKVSKEESKNSLVQGSTDEVDEEAQFTSSEPNETAAHVRAVKHVSISEELDDDNSGDGATSTIAGGLKPLRETVPEHPKSDPEKKTKKRKKKSSGKIKKPNPTGFEEFFADAPLTPSEYYEEFYDTYHHNRCFVERIEHCIQRYRSRRKLDSDRANVFNKYLALGGINSTIKAFTGGLDQDTIENSTALEIADIQAQDIIRSSNNPKFYDPSKPHNWVIDFEGVAKGFLSHRAPETFGRDASKVREYCGTLRNFLNYVTHHGVCSEYNNDIIAAKKICDLAEKELLIINEIGKCMPGDFNMAASTLYGGYHTSIFPSRTIWYQPNEDELKDAKKRRQIHGMSTQEASRIFKTAIAFCGSYEMFKAMKDVPKVINKEIRSMEVVSTTMPTLEKQKQYAGTKDENGEVGNIKPLGFLTVKPWDNPQAEAEDLTEEEEAAQKLACQARAASGTELLEEFWLEECLLSHCFVGMKFEAVVHDLDIGVKFFDQILGIYPSFFTFLPSERLEKWKEPKLNERPAPSVEDPHAGDEEIGDDWD